ncbi:MAG TPA: M3 family metallopeptidase, partial [candidate division Zixibacteria bacterium]|nr:M3 family metallopeptidase [candidate division Zixibacteria bacterium]
MAQAALKTKLPSAPTWDLDSIFPSGSKSKEFENFRADVHKKLVAANKLLKSLPTKISKQSESKYVKFINLLQELWDEIELVNSFSNCLSSQDVKDTKADAIYSEGLQMASEWQKLRAQLEALSLKISDKQWQALTEIPQLKAVKFYLNELRDIAKSKMPIELESLTLDLAVNGYHAWNQLYDKMAAELMVDFEEDGKTSKLSLGQLHTKMGSPNRELRKQAFEKMTGAWKSRENLAGMALNYMGGFRLSVYKNRGWKSPLYEPLVMARMKQKTLDTMWAVIEKNINRLKPYIDVKKKLLGIDKFRWYDEFAPCANAERLFTFDEAGDFVVDNLKDFSPDLAKFCRMALDKRWIEAEDRPGKRGGGYCTGMGPRRQSRIFMTYAGTYENLLTLAHELGHAYHSWVLNDKPVFAQIYPMNLAETASIFTENFVTNAALSQAREKDEKMMLLDQKLQG